MQNQQIIDIVSSENISKEDIEDILIKNNDIIISIRRNSENDRLKYDKIQKNIKNKISATFPENNIKIIINNQIIKNNKNEVVEKSFAKKIKSFFKKIIFPKSKENKSSDKTNFQSEKDKISKNNYVNKNSIKNVKKVIAVASAKGGVGKSTFAVNFALSLKKLGYKIAIVDADIYGPSIPLLMGLESKPETKNNLIIPIMSHGVKCISVGSIIEKEAAGLWRGSMVTKILLQLIYKIDWGFDNQDIDYMIIDMPPGTGDIYLSLAQNFKIDGVVLISSPQSLSIIDVVRSIDCFKKLGIKILGIVQNFSYFEINNEKKYIFGKDKVKDMANKYNIEFLGEIPISEEISLSSENSIPFVAQDQSSQISLKLGYIAEKIITNI